MSRSATRGPIGSVLLSRLKAWGLSTADGSSHVGRGLRTTPMYLHGWKKARWNRAEIEEFCAAWNVSCSGVHGWWGWRTVASHTDPSIPLFTKQVTEAWKAWLFAIISFIWFLFTFYSYLCMGVGNQCSFQPSCSFPPWFLSGDQDRCSKDLRERCELET